MNGEKNKTTTRPHDYRRAALGLVTVGTLLAISIVVMAADTKPLQRPPAPPPATEASPASAVPATAVVSLPSGERTVLITEGLVRGQLTMMVNKSTVVGTRMPFKRVSIAAPDIADVNAVGPSNILVTAKKPGTTQLIVWDDIDRSQVVDVLVNVDIDQFRQQLKEMFPAAQIDVMMANGQLILKGQVPSAIVAEQATALAAPFAPKVLNFLEVSGGQQIMLQVRFAEVSRSATNALGVNFGFNDGGAFGASNIGQVSPFGITGDGSTLSTPGPNPAVTLFGRGLLGATAFDYYITALRQNNLLRVLAEPNLVAISGQEASFLAGGEFPVPVTQGGGSGSGGTAITVEYRSFGVKLNFVPVVLGNGRVRLKVAPEVSDLDFTTAVKFNGFVIPGLTQRKLQTVVEMQEGQTIALAGLLNNNVMATKDVTPVLGDIPVVGALFRSVRYQRKETELVVIVTPRLVEAMNPAQVPTMPGEKWRHPTESELFWNRDLGGVTGDPSRRPATPAGGAASEGPARFKGQFGYVPAGNALED